MVAKKSPKSKSTVSKYTLVPQNDSDSSNTESSSEYQKPIKQTTSRSRTPSPTRSKQSRTRSPSPTLSNKPAYMPNHPPYEEMIGIVLENNLINGVTKQTILNRIKSKWSVTDRYAKPAIKSALKKMRVKRRVKRTVDGLYKRTKPKITKRSFETSYKTPSDHADQEWSSDTETISNLTKSSYCNLSNNLINAAKSNYFLDQNWPEMAEIKNKSLTNCKNQIREILLKLDAIVKKQGVSGISKDQLVYEVISRYLEPDSCYQDRRDKIEASLNEMRESGEIIKSINSGNIQLQKMIDNKILSNLTMRQFLARNKCSKRSDRQKLLFSSLQYFKNANFQNVEQIFNNIYPDFVQEIDDDIVSSVKIKKFNCSQTDQSKSSSAHVMETIRITCPCCRNDLMVTIRYSKQC